MKYFFMFITALLFVGFYQTLSLDFFNGDSYVYMTSYDLSKTHYNYWTHILLNPNSFGVQYRPFGFFGYFYFAKIIFGTNPLFYRLFALSLLFLSIILLNKILKKMEMSKLARYVSLTFYGLHSNIFYPVLDISCIAKYLIPSLLLICGILVILSNFSKITRLGIIFFLSLLSIMFHEGSIIFSLAFAALNVHFYKKDYASLFIIFLPATFYLIVRTFIWGWPNSGNFMEVGLEKVIPYFLNLSSSLWIPCVQFFKSDTTLFLLILLFINLVPLVLLLTLHKDKQRIYLLYLICAWLCLLPFCLLKNHVELHVLMKGGVWSLCFITMCLGLILTRLEKQKYFQTIVSKLMIVSFLIFFTWNSYQSKLGMLSLYFTFEQQVNHLRSDLYEKIKKDKLQKNTYTQINLNIDLSSSSKFIYCFYSEIFPAVITHFFNDYQFIIADKVGPLLLIKNGIFYYIIEVRPKEVLVKDIYGLTSKFDNTLINQHIDFKIIK